MNGRLVLHGGGSLAEKAKLDSAVEKDLVVPHADVGNGGQVNMLAVPFAKNEKIRSEFMEKFQNYYDEYNKYYNLQIDAILDPEISTQEIDDRIGAADIVYITGGNPLELDRNLSPEMYEKIVQAFEKDAKSVVGRSAGALLLAKNYYMEDPDGNPSFEQGRGYFPNQMVAHLTERNREKMLDEIVRTHKKSGIGIDEMTTLTLSNLGYNVVSDTNGAAYLYSINSENKQKTITELLKKGDLKPGENGVYDFDRITG